MVLAFIWLTIPWFNFTETNEEITVSFGCLVKRSVGKLRYYSIAATTANKGPYACNDHIQLGTNFKMHIFLGF